jgi:hypothetical protein
VIYFVKSKYNKIKELQIKIKEDQNSDQLLVNLIEDNYTDEKNFTLIETMFNLTIENVKIIILKNIFFTFFIHVLVLYFKR